MALPITLIEGTDTLENGFRAKSNSNFNSIVVDGNVDADGNLLLHSVNGDIEVPLSNYFASKGYANGVASTPPASETTSGRSRYATDSEVITGTNDSSIVTPLKLAQKFEDYFSNATHLGDASENLQIGHSLSLTEILGRFGIRNGDNFLGEFSVAELTDDRLVTLPDRDIEVNKWADLSGVPTSFTPSAHFHTIGEVTGLSDALAAKQPLNAILTALTTLTGNGIVRKTGTSTFVIGTNDEITLSGDVTGTGTTAITTTLANSGVTAGTYRSVTVDAKGRVTNGTNPTTIAGYGITDFNSNFDARWNTTKAAYVNFGAAVEIDQNLTVNQDFYVYGSFYDNSLESGSNNQFLRADGLGNFFWTSLSTAQISNFSTSVLGQLLTGLTAGSNTPLTSSDTVLTGFQNLQAQINNKAALTGTTNYLLKKTSTSVGDSQIFDDGTNIGIGTSSPLGKLHVNGTFALTSGEQISLTASNLNYNTIKRDTVNGGILLTANTYQTFFKDNGDVGIGTIDPKSKLHVNGTLSIPSGEQISLAASNLNYNTIKRDTINGGILLTANTYQTFFKDNGNVGIGTVTPAYKIDVNGTGRFVGAVQFDSIPSCAVAPSSANHLTNKAYVDSLALIKRGDTVKTISFTTLTKSGLYAVNGYTLLAGDLVLDAGGTSGGGVWVAASGAWSRSTTNDSDSEIRGAYHLITAGTYANSRYINTNTSSITLDTTSITYDVDFGAETDPVWNAYKTANDLTPTRFGNWNTAYGWGNHSGLYVDKVSTQSDIGGAKKFTTSIQSPIVKGGTDALGITILNYFGTAPRIASSSTMDFFSTGEFTWFTTGDLGRMKLTTTGLRIGSSTNPDFTLQVSGTTGLGGLLSVVSPLTGTYSSGSDGQVLMRRSVSSLNYNAWTTLTVSHISDIATYYQAKITGTENYLTKKTSANFGDSQIFDNGISVVIGGTSAIDSSKFSVVGKIGATNLRVGDNTDGINIGSLAINSTGALAYGATSHTWNVSSTEKLNLNSSRLALTGDFELSGRIKVSGSFGADHYFLKSNGTTQEWSAMTVGEISDIDTLYASKVFADANYIKRVTDQGERGFFLYGDADNTIKEGFMFSNPDTGIMGIHAFRLNGTTVEQYGFQLDKNGLPYWLYADGSRKRILTENDAVGTGSSAWNGGYITNDIQCGKGVDIFWGAITPPTINNYGARITWETETNVLNSYNFGNNLRGMLIETAYTSDNLYIGTSNELRLKGNKYFLGNVEIDMSTFAVGRYLRATSSTKAEWVV